LSSVLVKTTAK